MEKRVIALAATIGGLVVGVAGASVVIRAQAVPTHAVCITDSPVAEDAKTDAIMKQPHAHDHEQYVPRLVPPVGELPKPVNPN
jgi:hypothetical protein